MINFMPPGVELGHLCWNLDIMWNLLSDAMMAEELEDDPVVKAAALSIQAHERFYYTVNNTLGTNGGAKEKQIVSECRSIMDQLRQLKSKIEGSDMQQVLLQSTLDPTPLSQLQNLVLSHTPSSLSEQDKVRIARLLLDLLQGHVKEVVYCCLLTCPWFAATQSRLDEQAKKNRLFVVYVSSNEQFFSLATQHEKNLADVKDQGCLYATEVRNFCSGLINGNVRYIEALNAPAESLIVCSPHWLKLGPLLDPQHLFGLKFIERCVGQAVTSLGRKKQVKGEASCLMMNSSIPLDTFCDSFRLLSYLESIVEDKPLSYSSMSSNERSQKAKRLLIEAFKGLVPKEQLFEYALDWKKQLCDTGLLEARDKDVQLWSNEVGKWLADIRMGAAPLSIASPLPAEPKQLLSDLFTTLKLVDLEPEQVLVVCEGGSKLYNLSLPTSDSDYIIIFQHPITAILSSVSPLKEMQDSRGNQLLQEAGAYEARMFCEMLLKGSVNMFELLYADPVLYSSEVWLELVRNKGLFLSEKVILQYIGYIKTHMQRIKSGKFSGTARERKLFYSVFHKLLSLESLVEKKVPVIECTGSDRDFIMRIRTGPLKGELAPECLYSLVEDRLAKAREKLRDRTYRNREVGDYRYLQRWLCVNVRGLKM